MSSKAGRCMKAAAVAAIFTCLSLAAAKAQDKIKIGAPLALTGPLADEAKKQDIVWGMWANKVNAAGGINVGGKKMKVAIVKYDYQSNGQRASQIAEKLITDDKVNFLFAPFGSGHTKIVAAVAERYQTPVIACASSSETVFNQGLKYLFGTLSPNGAMTEAMVRYMKASVSGLKSIAILGRDDVFPKSMANGMSAAAKEAGIKIAYSSLYPVGTIDQSSALSAIKAAHPDWIYVTGYTQDLVLARKQMADLGVKAKVVTMVTGPAYREFTDALGDLANGITSWTWWTPAAAYKGVGVWPTTKSFVDEFVAKEKNEPDYIHASCAAGAEVLQNAIERAGSLDKRKVRDALASTNIVTFYGPVKFSPDGMNQTRSIPIIQVQNKQLKVLQPDDVKNANLKLMQ